MHAVFISLIFFLSLLRFSHIADLEVVIFKVSRWLQCMPGSLREKGLLFSGVPQLWDWLHSKEFAYLCLNKPFVIALSESSVIFPCHMAVFTLQLFSEYTYSRGSFKNVDFLFIENMFLMSLCKFVLFFFFPIAAVGFFSCNHRCPRVEDLRKMKSIVRISVKLVMIFWNIYAEWRWGFCRIDILQCGLAVGEGKTSV